MNCHSEVVRHNGVLKIKIDDKLYDPLSFKSFRANPQNVSEFYNAGVRLFSVLTSGVTSALGVPYSLYGESWIGDGKYDFTAIDRQMDMFCENAPDAYFAPMIQLDTRTWYLKSHPGVPNSFTNLSQIACDEEWKKAAADYLKSAITHIEEKYGDRVYGYFMLCGTTTEWFSDHDYEAPHPIKNGGYKAWTGNDNAELPSLERLNKKGDAFLGDDESDVYLARKFHNELIADLILYFASEAQSVIKKNKLLGVYYGYLFELGGARLFNAGSLAYEKVLMSDDINMISSPSSYDYRNIDDPSAFMVTAKTLDMHNKIYFLEFDHRTHLIPMQIREPIDAESPNCTYETGVFPGAENKYKDENETLNIMYRDFILCTANGVALWWFDMFDGWFRSNGMMNAVSHMLEISNDLSKKLTENNAEIAVFAEGEAMYRTRKYSGLATHCLSKFRRTLAECGAMYDLYSISDIKLTNVEKYKMFIFLNQYDISDEIKAEIDSKCRKNGKTILWMYAPDYAHGGACSDENISNITNICIHSDKVPHGGLVYNDRAYNYPISAPYFTVCDDRAVSLADFEDGATAVASRLLGDYTSVYCATCNLPSGLLRKIISDAGVFVYSENSKVYTYANSRVIGVYNASGAEAIIHLPEDGVYIDKILRDRHVCKDGIMKLCVRDINAYLLEKE